MKKGIFWIAVVLVLSVSLTACGLLREVDAPSATLEAVPLEVAPTASVLATEPVESVETTVEEATATEPAEPTVTEAAPPEEDAPAETAGAVIFSIDSSASRVRFELDEELRGQPTTVVGETDQVAGEMALDFADLSTAQVGVIQINARTLVTDNSFRNRAINNEILDTGTYELITFTPTAVTGLPDGVAIGDTVTFTIVGDLTIRDITNEVAFEVTATAVSASQISGTASTIVTRADYDLTIPSVPNVANVEEEVELYIDFTANSS